MAEQTSSEHLEDKDRSAWQTPTWSPAKRAWVSRRNVIAGARSAMIELHNKILQQICFASQCRYHPDKHKGEF